jgi:flagellar basal body P-ring protein FlgI
LDDLLGRTLETMFKYLFTFSNKRKAAMQINVANWKHLRTKFDELKLMTAVSEVDDIIQTPYTMLAVLSSMRSQSSLKTRGIS